jgi:PadR family transcriptional regulator, regulatory protein PadR
MQQAARPARKKKIETDMKIESELMRGAGPTAVLRLLSGGEKYGYELVEALSRQTDGVLAMGQSTLYPLLYNLEAKGLVKSRVDQSGARPRRYYRLTQKGERKLAADTQQWQSLIQALGALGIAPQKPVLGGAR